MNILIQRKTIRTKLNSVPVNSAILNQCNTSQCTPMDNVTSGELIDADLEASTFSPTDGKKGGSAGFKYEDSTPEILSSRNVTAEKNSTVILKCAPDMADHEVSVIF